MKVLIIGGVAGGASAATRLRRLSEDAEIILFEKGEFISYANCGLPYYIGQVIKEKERLVVTRPEILENRFNVRVRTMSEVIRIDREKKTVTVHDHRDDTTYEESYDKLVLSPGSEPKRPPLPGIDQEGIFTLRTVPDTYKIDDFISARQPRRAVVVGAGFIGIEMAENLKERGLQVTVVEYLDQVIPSLDPEMAAILHQHLRENGIRLRLSTGVAGFEAAPEGGLKVLLTVSSAGGTDAKSPAPTPYLDADLVILSIGVAPESRLAKEAGLTLGERGTIAADDTYVTSDPSIYAVGDAISVRHFVTGAEASIPLAGPANKQGRAAAENLLGRRVADIGGVQGTSILKVFDLTAASSGMNEKQLKTQNLPYEKIYVHPASHASYYPGALQISMKLLFDQAGTILGVQAVGFDGVDKRVDVIATAMRLGGTVYDLENLELCYAPPYSSAKDPVNMAGFTAANLLRGDTKVFHYDEVERLDQNKVSLVDVSTPEEVQMGTIENSINLPLDELRSRIAENPPALPLDQPVYVFCRVGLRGYIASRILMQKGYDVYNLSGGYKTYSTVLADQKARQADEHTPLKEEFMEQKASAPASVDPPNAKTSSLEFPSPDTQKPETLDSEIPTLEVDACGLQCPGPIMKVAQGMNCLDSGQCLKIRATDPAFASDISIWCERTGNLLLDTQREKGVYTVLLRKGLGSSSAGDAAIGCSAAEASAAAPCPPLLPASGNDKTMVIFSGDLDKALAAFIIANGAAAMGRKVTLFFTFWGLNVLRKNQHISVKKNFIETMFGKMMPRGSKKLGLSRMNMGGMGAKMIRSVMQSKNVQSLEELITAAMDSGVRVIACQMSMDVMGIRQEELIDGVEIAGVATFLGSAETSDTNLFI